MSARQVASCRVIYLYQGAEEDEEQAAERAGKAAYDRVLAKVRLNHLVPVQLQVSCCWTRLPPPDSNESMQLHFTHVVPFCVLNCLHGMHPAAACEQACRCIAALRHFLQGGQQRQAVRHRLSWPCPNLPSSKWTPCAPERHMTVCFHVGRRRRSGGGDCSAQRCTFACMAWL